ncbi:TetR/AcrR family transcriptional regulator [Streptomyces hydrogenans]|uniref:TetR family transcriptional regulator n=1 Tax=Streptomyces hydrogenans TaxID=1873719 RepID=A0ABQ3PR38_9ACTN|nr:TetR/AcrR family transcriptional regulator [Streptomyces hydrogenans]GHG22771.1 TetR family transcriptional regulator [Streptomyces hydrogenans]GHI27488.1 TetR family transcriptional regulator [Streptomyces hydrogenans]
MPSVSPSARPAETARPVPATRPRNRRQLIVDAAGRVFSERGYHAASMEDVAARVDITATALYRHFPNKYALFAECAGVMVDGLVAALDEVPSDAPLTEVLTAVARITVAHRASGGVYRWEARYLEREDRRRLKTKYDRVVDRVDDAVRREHPFPDGRLRATAALGAIGSITMHRTSIAQRRAEDLLVKSALGVAASDPGAEGSAPAPVELPARPVPRTRRDEILAAAVPLFARDGFASVTNGQIARAVGLTPSALYRHYPGKIDVLAAACLQAADLLARGTERSLRGVTAPYDAVVALAATHVAYCFEYTDLNSVAEAELPGLPADPRRPLVLAQRKHIAVWEHWLRLARPELDSRQARALAHAGFGVVVEAGRRLRWRDGPAARRTVTRLVVGALGL